MIENYQGIWFGHNPPKDFANLSLDFISTTDTRLSPSHYNKYNRISFSETCISDFSKWPFILDELFKLSNGLTTFTIKFNSLSSTFSIPKFYKQIHDLSSGSAKFLKIEQNEIAGIYTLVFTAIRRNFDNSRNWSFGILWDGKNENLLKEYVLSVEKQLKHGSKIEILICGPKPSFDINISHIIIETDDTTEKYANISRKKNLIIHNSNYENICIAHNRYKLDDGFIKSFDRFNHDFEICVVRQVLSDTGIRVPDWVSQASDQKLTANYLLPYGSYSPFQYVPGGLVIGKKNVLSAIPFNDLATWNMAEDVELSLRLNAAGFLPRLNSKSVVSVLQLRKEIIDDFKSPDIDNFYTNIDLFNPNSNFLRNNSNSIKRNIKLLVSEPSLFFRKLKLKIKV